jgi:hypothetical protein
MGMVWLFFGILQLGFYLDVCMRWPSTNIYNVRVLVSHNDHFHNVHRPG